MCALLAQRLAFVAHNAQRVCQPLLADPSALPLAPVPPPDLPVSPLSRVGSSAASSLAGSQTLTTRTPPRSPLGHRPMPPAGGLSASACSLPGAELPDDGEPPPPPPLDAAVANLSNASSLLLDPAASEPPPMPQWTDDLAADGSAYIPEEEWSRQGVVARAAAAAVSPATADDPAAAAGSTAGTAAGTVADTAAGTAAGSTAHAASAAVDIDDGGWDRSGSVVVGEDIETDDSAPPPLGPPPAARARRPPPPAAAAAASSAASEWRVTRANEAYALCASYPSLLVVPAAVTDAQVAGAAKFRSKGRLPVLTWRHPNGAALCRSSQPLTGISERRSAADEALVGAIAATGPVAGQPPLIIDARSRIAASGNQVLGKGTESESNYRASVAYLDIANIHAVRNSFLKLHELHAKSSSRASEYLRSLDESAWLSHLASLLRAAHRTAHCLHERRRPTLVHCSDGWDRTAQVCVLTQLLLDPYYRTLRGLATLLDKDMVFFGHKSAERLGLAPDGASSDEWSPIWIQLLDCIQQVVRQFPHAFEFDAAALGFLATHCYAGFVTTFRHNTIAQRDADKTATRSTSVWAQLLARADHFANPGYRPWPLASGPLRPACALQRMAVWELHLPPMRCLAQLVISECAWCSPHSAHSAHSAAHSAATPAAAAAAAAGAGPTRATRPPSCR